MKKITILIAEDHQLVRKALTYVLNNDNRFEVVAEATSGEATVELAMIGQPDIILMDINLEGMNGIEATARIAEVCPAIKIIAMTMHKEPYSVKQMLDAGASGYLSKNASPEELCNCIYSVYNGSKYFSAEIKEIVVCNILNRCQPGTDMKKLSKREIEIARFIKNGNSSKKIASILGIALRTVEVHRYNLFRKLNTKNSISLIRCLNEKPYLLDWTFV